MSTSSSPSAGAQNYPLPPPFTPKDFWSKVVQVVSERDGYVTHEHFEKVFGVPLHPGTPFPDGRGYGLAPGTEWYIGTFLQQTTAEFKGVAGSPPGVTSGLQMEWPENAFGDPKAHQCVLASDAIDALRETGWKVTTKPIWAITRNMMADELLRGNGQLLLYHYNYTGPIKEDRDSCVTKFNVSGRP